MKCLWSVSPPGLKIPLNIKGYHEVQQFFFGKSRDKNHEVHLSRPWLSIGASADFVVFFCDPVIRFRKDPKGMRCCHGAPDAVLNRSSSNHFHQRWPRKGSPQTCHIATSCGKKQEKYASHRKSCVHRSSLQIRNQGFIDSSKWLLGSFGSIERSIWSTRAQIWCGKQLVKGA
jgi:hypothetical protein